MNIRVVVTLKLLINSFFGLAQSLPVSVESVFIREGGQQKNLATGRCKIQFSPGAIFRDSLTRLNNLLSQSLTLKGTVQRDFRHPVFSQFKPAWSTDQKVKYFRFNFQFNMSICVRYN